VFALSAEEGRSEREEIEDLLKTLRAAIMELRSAIDELSNPVVPPSAPPRRAQQAAQQAAGRKPEAPAPGKPEAPKQPAPPTQPAPKPATPGETLSPQVAGVPVAITRAAPTAPVAGPTLGSGEVTLERLARLMRLVYELQTKVPPEYLSGLADILYGSGLIDEAQRDTLKRIVDLARLGYEHGLSVDESVAILAALAKELGLDVASITEELVKAVLRRRGAEQWESQQQ
jgi:DNA-binding transcriptional ArsR family regulator